MSLAVVGFGAYSVYRAHLSPSARTIYCSQSAPPGRTRPANAGPFECARQNRNNAAAASGNGSDIERRANLHANFESKCQFRSVHLDVFENNPNRPLSELLFFSASPGRTPKRSTTCVRLLPKAVFAGTGFPSISAFWTAS